MKTSGVFLIFTLLLGCFARASHSISGFELKDCVSKGKCFELTAPRAQKPSYDNTIYLTQPRLHYAGKVIAAEDGYFDVDSGRIVLRGLQKRARDLSFEIKTGELKYFP